MLTTSQPKKILCFIAFCLINKTLFAQAVCTSAIDQMFKKSSIVNDHFTGFALYDQDRDSMIYEWNANKYFTPASNTKLFTFYAGLSLLKDSIPGLRYITKGDSLIFWGTGDPSLFHNVLKTDKVYQFLKKTPMQLFYSPANYTGPVYGNGWAWNDYNDDYQTELNPLPQMGNVIRVYSDNLGRLQVSPGYFQSLIQQDSSFHPSKFTVERSWVDNHFRYPDMPVPKNFVQEIPIKTSPNLTITLLQDTLKRSIKLVNEPMPAYANVLYSIPVDSVYKAMLLPSDNFIAEHLLLTSGSVLNKPLHTDSIIAYIRQNYLKELPDEPQWADGSGLSRYNLFTPRSMIVLLKKISDKVNNEERLHSLLPAGGKTGTLRKAYSTDKGKAFVWAKTGTLSNNHNQSGYLVTRKGRRLIFSFMNNNYVSPTSVVRQEMVRIMTCIHEIF